MYHQQAAEHLNSCSSAKILSAINHLLTISVLDIGI